MPETSEGGACEIHCQLVIAWPRPPGARRIAWVWNGIGGWAGRDGKWSRKVTDVGRTDRIAMRHVRTLYVCIILVVNKSLSVEVPYTGRFWLHNATEQNNVTAQMSKTTTSWTTTADNDASTVATMLSLNWLPDETSTVSFTDVIKCYLHGVSLLLLLITVLTMIAIHTYCAPVWLRRFTGVGARYSPVHSLRFTPVESYRNKLRLVPSVLAINLFGPPFQEP